jgi:hypothetical protein
VVDQTASSINRYGFGDVWLVSDSIQSVMDSFIEYRRQWDSLVGVQHELGDVRSESSVWHSWMALKVSEHLKSELNLVFECSQAQEFYMFSLLPDPRFRDMSAILSVHKAASPGRTHRVNKANAKSIVAKYANRLETLLTRIRQEERARLEASCGSNISAASDSE